jgi:LacI family transcriptional regulator
MKLAIDHLRAAGHRTIGCLIGKTDIGNPRQRFKYLEQLIGNPALVKLVGPDDYMEEVGKLLRCGVDAIFCPGGNGGIITAYALFLYNKRIPDDISLVASERAMVSRYCIPPQSAISQNYEALATAAVNVIDARLNGRQTPPQTVLPYHLIERDSVANRTSR